MKSKISIVTLGVRDLAASRRFYSDGLGWAERPDGSSDIAFLELDNIVLSLYRRDKFPEEAAVPFAGEAAGTPTVTLAINFASAAEVDAAMREAVAAGANEVQSPHKVFWGGYSGYFADPDGYLWELAYNPYSPEWV